MPANTYDAIVIGGGHNGLVAGAYLARSGRRTVVIERREVVGGAAVTEQPWGPDYKVTMLSYVVSLLPPTILAKVTRIRELHVSDVGLKYGTPSDVLDVEAMLRIEGTDELFGFTLRTGTDEEAHDAMFELLRTAFQKNLPIRIEYDRETHRTNRVFRVIRN